MADHTKEEIEAGMNALRWHLNRLISDLSDNLTDKDVHQLAAGLEDALGTMDKAWDSFCRSRDGFRPPADPFPPIPHADEGEAQMRMEKEMGIWPEREK